MRALQGRTALVFGAGGLGGPAALALASADVGRIVLADAAPVAPRDLADAPLLRPADLGTARAQAAAAVLARRFPACAVLAVGERAGAELVPSADVVVDASNRFPIMFLAGDAAAAAARPLVHAGVLGLAAQLLTVLPGETGCLRCLFEGPPPAGVAADALAPGPLAGLAGSLLGAEALRVLGGRPAAYAGRLLVHDARTGRARAVPVPRRPGCAACGGLRAARARSAGAVATGGAP